MPSVTLRPGLGVETIPCEEGSSAGSFEIGDLVAFDSNGQVVIATSGVIDGIAETSATGTQSITIQVNLIDPNTIYIANYKSASATQTLVGDCLDFTFTAGAHTLDESGADTDCYCVGLADPEDSTSARLLIRFYGTLMTASAT